MIAESNRPLLGCIVSKDLYPFSLAFIRAVASLESVLRSYDFLVALTYRRNLCYIGISGFFFI